jgi:MFS transporter, NNP family, nitrate/nitrite transporter
VPILLFVAGLTLIYGQDHPTGKWSKRHTMAATAIAIAKGHQVHVDRDEEPISRTKVDEKDSEKGIVDVHTVDVDEEMARNVESTVDIAVNESLTVETALKILASPLTWLPSLAYLTTFGLELVMDAQMANVLFALFGRRIQGFDQTKAGYYTSILSVILLLLHVGED